MYQTSSSFLLSLVRFVFLLLAGLGLLSSTSRGQTVLSLTAATASQSGTVGSYTVPSGGPYKYRITAKGARGGNSNGQIGGKGATLIGEFMLLSGQTIEAIAGAPGSQGQFAGGGGGGSGARVGTIPLMIAGAGGGTGNGPHQGLDATTAMNGVNGQNNLQSGSVGTGGVAGNGGTGGGYTYISSGGGGGMLSAGGNGTENYGTGGGTGFAALGGTGSDLGGGGFGGGGGGNLGGSGGGGGYSGGGGGGGYGAGGGGGSINYGTNQINTSGSNNAGGEMLVEWIGSASAFAPVITATQPACGSTTGRLTIDLTGDFNNSTNSVEYAVVSGGSFSGTPTFTTINAEPFSVTSGTGTLATGSGSTYTIRVRLIYNPTIYTDYTYILTVPPTRLYVKATATGANTGQSWADAFTDLQSALNYANPQCLTEIWVAAGTYKPTTATNNQNASFSMKNGVAIYGGFVGSEANLSDRPAINSVNGQPSSTTLSGDINNDGTLTGNSTNLFNNNGLNATAILNGFVITGGNGPSGYGGAMYNLNSSPMLTNCSFVGNSAAIGGAMYNLNSSPMLTNCSFVGNSAPGWGGAMTNYTGSSPMLTNCSFQSNTSPRGGAMFSYVNSNPGLTNCSFIANSATQEGGAINYQTSNVTLINCGFLNNQTAGNGGAIFTYNSTLQVINGSFQNNTASSGGAINTFNGMFTLTNCVAFGNGGSNTFINTVNNSSPSGFTATYSLFEPASVTVTGMDVSGPGNLTTTSSPFASTANVALNGCPPAINAGSNAAYTSANGPATDMLGQGRFFASGHIDMGAVEYQGTPNIQTSITTGPVAGSVVCAGANITASVSVLGTGPFTYQWYKDGLEVNNQTSATLSLTNVQTSDAGSYSVVATGSCNSVTSTAFSLTVTSSPTRLYVKAGASGANTGLNWTDAFTDLQSALNYNCSGSLTEIWVAAGTYKPTTSTTDRDAHFSMKNGVAIYGGFVGTEQNLSERPAINPVSGQPSSTILSGDINNDGTLNGNSKNVVSNGPGITTTAILNGFVITGGNTLNVGGGMSNTNSSPTLINCSFLSNSSGYGGGMSNTNSNPTLTNCSFINNTATYQGGGMYSNNVSSPMLTNCIFLNNNANRGGAILIYSGGNLVLTNCSFSSNTATSEGGAIDLQNSQATLINCGFLANLSNGSGGAIFSFGSPLRVTNSSFQSNTASSGGAIHSFNSVATLTNCVAFGNGGSNSFTNQVNNTNPSGFTVTYSLFEPASVTVTGMDVSGLGNLITTSSPFASTATVALNACAPAINAGSNSAYTSASGPATDMLGQGRFFASGHIDMGAVEYQGTPNLQTGFTAQPVAGAAVCEGATVTASVIVSGTGPFTYQWYKDGTLVNNQSSATLSLTNVQTGDAGGYSVVVTGGCNSVTSTTFSLTVNSSPVASFSNNGPLTCANPTAILTASGGNTYQFSAGATHSGPASNSATVSQGGVYSVTVLNAAGCSAVASTTVTVDQTPPVVSIQPASATLTCTSPLVSLSAVGVGTYRWSNGATTSAISVTSANTYSVTLTGMNGCSSTATVNINADQTPPSLTIQPASATLTCSAPSVSLSAIGAGVYRWSNGATSPVISATSAGTYSITLTGANGCSATATTSISLNNTPPSVSISPTNATLTCATPSVSLSALRSGSLRWNTGATTSAISVTSAGSYSVTVTGANGCTASTSVVVGIDQLPPSVSIASSSTVLSCTTTLVSLSVVGSGTYRWNMGSTTSVVSATSAGVYSVTLTGANGCSSTASITIGQDQTPPSVSIASASTTLSCTTLSVSLSAVGTGIYRWNTGATTASISVSVVGTYSLTLTGANGCSSTASVSVTYQNCGPTVANAIAPQSATLGQVFSYTIPANTFTDAETPNSLILSVLGLPNELSFVSPNMITGTLSTTLGSPFSVTVVATDPGGLSVRTSFLLMVQTQGLGITGITMLDCNHVGYFERRINFTVRFEATNGQPISLSVVNETRTITVDEPYQLNLFTDNPVIIFKASQQGTPGESTFAYNWLAYCANGNPRVENPIPPQSVTVGQAFSYTIPANTFTDAETPNSLSLSAVGLPSGLSLAAPNVITGLVSATASSFYSVTVIATDASGGSVSTLLPLSIVNSGSCASMYTVQAGNWSDAAVWSCGRVPLLTDVVTLNHAVNLPASYVGQALRVIYSSTGRLSFGAGSRLKLGID